MNKFIAAVVIVFCSSVASANILYNVNRTIGAGSVVGTIETDGTLGQISSANIVDWTFTLTSASLSGGSPGVITKATALQTSEFGGFVQATANEISFDFSASPSGYGWLLFQGAGGNFWCMQINACYDYSGPHEAIGFADFGGAAEAVAYDTRQVIATTIPEPASWALMLAGGVGVLGIARRRQQR